ncbi:hypothetical protein BDR26DRAFT_856008 [Obelidium mucronatum]|nr:hypothetical protein BDR26DRAFT_856008 [Obelidium mucronatum]
MVRGARRIVLFVLLCCAMVLFMLYEDILVLYHHIPYDRVCNAAANCDRPKSRTVSSNNTDPNSPHSLDLSMDNFDPGQIQPYGSPSSRAQELIKAVIIICDTIPHGRALLESLLEVDPARQCQSKIVVEMTNRFDWEVKDKELLKRSEKGGVLHGRLFFVANNPVEQLYLENAVGWKVPNGVRLLRPLGLSKDYEYPAELPPAKDTDFIARAFYCGSVYSILSNQYEIPINIVPAAAHYGGPGNLLAFKGFIDFPYQYSVMKFYENIAYGVPQFIPTPRLLEQVLKNGLHCADWVSVPLLKRLIAHSSHRTDPSSDSDPKFPKWSHLMDFYNPLFRPFVYYFDSFQELADLNLQFKNSGRKEIDTKQVRVKGREFYIELRKEIVRGWADLFREMGFAINIKP